MSHSTHKLPTVNKSTTTRKQTFTLIEMLVVVVIIGILAVALIPRLVGAKERASDSARIVKVGQISSAVELYAQEQGSKYPLAPLTGAPGISIATPSVTSAISPYLTNIPTDPGKGTVAISTEPGGILATGDSFAYWTNTGGTVYAITALMESKKGNTTNGTGVIDSDKQGGYQKVGRGLTENIVAGGGGSYPTQAGVHYVGNDIVVTDGTTTYVIADKNIGATEAGTDGNNPAIRGAFFQQGNNHPFSSTVGETITPNSTGLVDTSTYNGMNPYNNSTWIYGTTLPNGDWSIAQNDNLRGNTTNTNVARKGPCEAGYHVPTQAERQGLYNVWVSLNPGQGGNGNLFRDTLKLPMAGNRRYDFASLVSNQGSYGNYWSSTPNGAYARNLYFYAFLVNPGGTSYRANGYSVRCFKNSY